MAQAAGASKVSARLPGSSIYRVGFWNLEFVRLRKREQSLKIDSELALITIYLGISISGYIQRSSPHLTHAPDAADARGFSARGRVLAIGW